MTMRKKTALLLTRLSYLVNIAILEIPLQIKDPNYKGENILSSKKWRSKTVGEDQVSIVIQLSKPSLRFKSKTSSDHFLFLPLTLIAIS